MLRSAWAALPTVARTITALASTTRASSLAAPLARLGRAAAATARRPCLPGPCCTATLHPAPHALIPTCAWTPRPPQSDRMERLLSSLSVAEDSRACLIDCQRITWCTRPDGSRVLLGEGGFGQVRESGALRVLGWGGVGNTVRAPSCPPPLCACSAWLAGVARWPDYCKLKPAGSRVACLRPAPRPCPGIAEASCAGWLQHALVRPLTPPPCRRCSRCCWMGCSRTPPRSCTWGRRQRRRRRLCGRPAC